MSDNKNFNFDEIIASREGNLFVFNFGATGCGKSTMLAGIFQQCIKSGYAITYNMADKHSFKIFNDYTRKLYRYNELPEQTPLLEATDYLQICDITLDGQNLENKAGLTFFEISGENLEGIHPYFKSIIEEYEEKKSQKNNERLLKEEQNRLREETKNKRNGAKLSTKREQDKKDEIKIEPEIKSTNEAKMDIANDYKANHLHGEFGNVVDKVIKSDIPIVILLSASYSEAFLQDALINAFLSYIEKINPDKIIGMAAIITMWDKNNKAEKQYKLLDFFNDNLKETFNKIELFNKEGRNSEGFNFSIGKVDEKTNKVTEHNFDYSKKILDWLLLSGKFIEEEKKPWWKGLLRWSNK